uniref:Uncharacterized protein n=1 Tax=Panagrellus redivivus TaxID=6233 RepID=A0A7E4UQN7_PANRE
MKCATQSILTLIEKFTYRSIDCEVLTRKAMFSDKADKGKSPRKPPIPNQLQRRNEATAAYLEPTRNDVSVKTSFRAL